MERILWSDGHVTLINAEEAYRKSHEEITDNGYIWVLVHGGSEFEWNYDMWVQR